MIANRPFETVANVAASGNSIVNEVFVVWWPYCDCARRVSDCRGQSNGLIMETSVNRRCNLVMGSWCLFGEYSSVCGVCVCVWCVCACVRASNTCDLISDIRYLMTGTQNFPKILLRNSLVVADNRRVF